MSKPNSQAVIALPEDDVVVEKRKRRQHIVQDTNKRYHSVFEQLEAETTEEYLDGLNHAANSSQLTRFVALTIVVNALMIGIEVDTVKTDALEETLIFVVTEIIFLGVFLLEMFLKMDYAKWSYFLDPWNILDYHLIVLGFVDVVIRYLISQEDINKKSRFSLVKMLLI